MRWCLVVLFALSCLGCLYAVAYGERHVMVGVAAVVFLLLTIWSLPK